MGVNTFGREKEVFAREAATGATPIAYFLGKALADTPFMLLGALMFVAPMVAIAPWRAPVEDLYVILLIYIGFTNALGYVLSFLFHNADDATLCGVILIILLNLFGGFVPKLGDNPQGKLFAQHWLSRAMVAVELQYGQLINEIKIFNSLVPNAWADPDWSQDLGILFLITVSSLPNTPSIPTNAPSHIPSIST